MDIRAIIMGLAFALMWSSAFTSAKIIVAGAPPMLALSVRFLISGGIAVALALAAGQSWRLTRRQWTATVIFGICQNGLYLGLNFIAMQWVQASLAAIIASSLPLWVALAGWAIYGERLTLMAVLGLVAGIAGVALVMGTRIGAGVDIFGIALCVVAVLALMTATMLLRGASAGGNVVMVVGLQMLVGALPLGLFGLMTETPMITPSWALLGAFTYTTLFPGVIATLVWFNLVHRIGPTKAATFHFLNPFLGVAVAAMVLDEALGALDVLGVAIITAGIFIVQRSRAFDNRVKGPQT